MVIEWLGRDAIAQLVQSPVLIPVHRAAIVIFTELEFSGTNHEISYAARIFICNSNVETALVFCFTSVWWQQSSEMPHELQRIIYFVFYSHSVSWLSTCCTYPLLLQGNFGCFGYNVGR